MHRIILVPTFLSLSELLIVKTNPNMTTDELPFKLWLSLVT